MSMKYTDKFKKAFTLIEITIAILVIAVLVLLCMPIINNQMRKTEEFAYYTAYKTLEKLAAQILVVGDSANDNVVLNNYNSYPKFISPAYAAFYDDNGNSLRSYLDITPASINMLTNFSEYEWKYAAVKAGNEGIIKEASSYYDPSLPLNPSSIRLLYINSLGQITSFARYRFSADQYNSIELLNFLKTYDDNGTGGSMHKYCQKLGSVSNIDTYYIRKNDPDSTAAECIVIRRDPMALHSATSYSEMSLFPVANTQKCDNQHGYSGTVISNGIGCRCNNGVFAANNPKACCPTPPADSIAYYRTTPVVGCINCSAGAYNETTGLCCPANSKYSSSRRTCVCDDGYSMNADGSACNRSDANCPLGSHMTGAGAAAHCVQNPPYLLASRFCEAINNLWNTSSPAVCNTFTLHPDGRRIYQAVYEAATNDGHYLNINATPHAFDTANGGPEPNIVFSNGMIMWILGDRAASIPGLSYNPDAYTAANRTHTVCNFQNGVTTQADCGGAPNYFCRDEGRCYSVSSSVDGSGNPILGDARNCCSLADFNDLIANIPDYTKDARVYAISGFTVFMDIDGATKGSGTLWDDVFPFYITADGQVYPGYPLNASDGRSKYIGGNSSYLATDVYYYRNIGGNRRKHYVDKGIPLARALCLTKKISVNTPYCLNLGVNFRKRGGEFVNIENYVNNNYDCHDHNCYIHVKNKVKFF